MSEKTGNGHIGQGGFTLVEVIVAIAILAILTSMAIPGYRTSVLNNRLRSASNELLTLMHAARNEAAKQGTWDVIVCSSTGVGDGCSGNSGNAWRDGVLVFVNNVDATNKDLDAGETVLTYTSALPQNLTYVTTKSELVFSPTIVPTNPNTQGTINLCDDRGTSHARKVVVNKSGRAYIARADEGASVSCS